MKKLSTLLLLFFFSFNGLSQVKRLDAFPVPGRLIDLGGYKLHIHCEGKKNPAVVLISGSGDFSFDWALIQKDIKSFSKVCSYDRSGLAWSDLGPVPRTMRQEVFELHLLLKKAKIRGPYILVGHSLGGLLARLYCQLYPSEVAGLIFIDSTTDDTQLLVNGKIVRIRTFATGKKIPPAKTYNEASPQPATEEDIKQAEFNRQMFGPPKINEPFDKLPSEVQQLRLWALNNEKLYAHGEDYWADELEEMYQQRTNNKYLLGNIPLIVIIPQQDSQPPEGLGFSKEEWEAVTKEKRKQKIDLADMSSNSKIITVENTGHHVQLEKPQIIVNAIREMITVITSKSKLE